MKRVLDYWWVGFLGLGALAVVAILVGPRGIVALQQVQDPAQSCAPQPCVAPAGFELDLLNATSGNGVVEVQVGFKNHTAKDFGAYSYRPTSPHDFFLRLPDGSQKPPVFKGDCKDWGELHVARGQSGGPETLCFEAASLHGARLGWAPDLGLLYDESDIPLD